MYILEIDVVFLGNLNEFWGSSGAFWLTGFVNVNWETTIALFSAHFTRPKPIRFFLWGYLKNDFDNNQRNDTVDELKATIMEKLHRLDDRKNRQNCTEQSRNVYSGAGQFLTTFSLKKMY